VRYLPSGGLNKERIARQIAREDKIQEGLLAVLTAVEPCRTYDIFRNRDLQKLQLVPRVRKCLFLYHYFVDPIFGFMNARIQTWFPFSIQICLNGREWLAREMDREGLAYRREDNCFPWIADAEQAQTLMDRQLRTRWPELLRAIARRLNPDHGTIFPELELDYYWSVYQSEWASDLMFRNAENLAEIYPALVRHGIGAFSSPDVMRFLGQKPHWNLDQEIRTSFKDRVEGVRIKHWVGSNSAKLYDKGSILRAEATLQDPTPFKVYRAKEGDPDGPKAWRGLRAGIADLARRATISQAINDRYVEAMAAADTSIPVGRLAAEMTGPVRWQGRRMRGLRPWESEDLKLFRAVNDGKWTIHGFRNRDLQEMLFEGPAGSPQEQRRRSARVTRLIRLLRAHGLVKKEPRARRYSVTARGRETMTALLAAQDVTLENLRKLVA